MMHELYYNDSHKYLNTFIEKIYIYIYDITYYTKLSKMFLILYIHLTIKI